MVENNILVSSHRRSGTHFVIDSLLLNIENVSKDYINLDQLLPTHDTPIQLSILKKTLEYSNAPVILKTHMTHDLCLFRSYPDMYSYVVDLIDKVKKIYVHRDGRDVLVSLYEYMRRYNTDVQQMDFHTFLRSNDSFYAQCNWAQGLNRVEMWREHLRAFMNRKDIYCVAYENLSLKFEETIRGLLSYLGFKPPEHPIKPIIDKRTLIARLSRRSHESNRTSIIFPRKGIVGDYRRYFNDEDLEFFDEHAGIP